MDDENQAFRWKSGLGLKEVRFNGSHSASMHVLVDTYTCKIGPH